MSHAALAFELLRWCTTRDAVGGRRLAERCALVTEARRFLVSREIETLHALASGIAAPRQCMCDRIWALQQQVLREVVEALTRAEVRTLIFKGGELVTRFYGDHSLGLISDIDLLVPYRDIETARSVLYKLDFRHRYFDPEAGGMVDRDLRETAHIELHHYELAAFTRTLDVAPEPELLALAEERRKNPLVPTRTGALVVFEIDIHHSVATDIEPDMFFARAIPSVHGVGETFAPADHLWFNLSRMYMEVALHNKISLRPLAYTLPLIVSGEVDWDVVKTVAAEFRLGPTLYYYLALADQLVPGHIPVRTLAAVQASANERSRDWGWQLGKLFDFAEGFPHDAFADQDMKTA